MCVCVCASPQPPAHLAVHVTPLPPPARGAGAASVQCVAGPAVPTEAGEVAAQAPRATGAVDGAVHSMPAFGGEGEKQHGGDGHSLASIEFHSSLSPWEVITVVTLITGSASIQRVLSNYLQTDMLCSPCCVIIGRLGC